MSRRTDFVAVPTRDRERASDFYGRTLGLARSPTSTDTWIEFREPHPLDRRAGGGWDRVCAAAVRHDHAAGRRCRGGTSAARGGQRRVPHRDVGLRRLSRRCVSRSRRQQPRLASSLCPVSRRASALGSERGATRLGQRSAITPESYALFSGCRETVGERISLPPDDDERNAANTTTTSAKSHPGIVWSYAADPPKLGSAPCGLSARPFGSSQSSCRPSADKSRMP